MQLVGARLDVPRSCRPARVARQLPGLTDYRGVSEARVGCGRRLSCLSDDLDQVDPAFFEVAGLVGEDLLGIRP